MIDVEQQIEAWADAMAPPTGEAIDAAEIMEGRHTPTVIPLTEPRAWRGWLLAAAAALVVGVLAAGLAVRWGGDGSERVHAGDPDTATSVPDGTATTVAVPWTGLDFDLLGEGGATAQPIGSLRSAQDADELAQLWSSSMRGLPVPEVDFTEQVVVSMTIGTSACPPTLSGFARAATTVEPRFVESHAACDLTHGQMTYVAALDWSVTGDDFLLLLLFDVEGDGQQETLQITR